MIDQAPSGESTTLVAVGSRIGLAETSARGAISASDVDFLAALAMCRGNSPTAERHRLEMVRSLLAAASDVNRTLSIFLQHALVHCQGTPGCSDLAADTRAVASALGNLSARFSTSAEHGVHLSEYEGQTVRGDQRAMHPRQPVR